MSATNSSASLLSISLTARQKLCIRVINFGKAYAKYHGPVALAVCSVGIVFNIYFLLLLAHRDFRTWLNKLLAGVALCNLVLMISYLIYILHFKVLYGSQCEALTYFWAVFSMIHALGSITLYGTSVYITVYISLARVYKLNFDWWKPFRARNTFAAILGILGFVIMSCSPIYAATQIAEVRHACPSTSIYVLRFATPPSNTLFRAAIWLHGAVLKAVPSLLLLISIICTLISLRRIAKRRMKVIKRNLSHSNAVTVSLTLILVLFSITQIPQAMINIAIGLAKTSKDKLEYLALIATGDFCDLLSLTNSSISFPLYCLSNYHCRQQMMASLRRVLGRQRTGYNVVRKLLLPNYVTWAKPTTSLGAQEHPSDVFL